MLGIIFLVISICWKWYFYIISILGEYTFNVRSYSSLLLLFLVDHTWNNHPWIINHWVWSNDANWKLIWQIELIFVCGKLRKTKMWWMDCCHAVTMLLCKYTNFSTEILLFILNILVGIFRSCALYENSWKKITLHNCHFYTSHNMQVKHRSDESCHQCCPKRAISGTVDRSMACE